MSAEIERLESEVVYRNRWMTVREDRVRRRDGGEGIYGVVDKPDYSLIIPFDGESLHLVEQYRYPVSGRYWEFPQGSLDAEPDADPAQVAARELAEETGLRASTLRKLGVMFQAYGYSTQSVHVFLATDLSDGSTSLDPEEHGLITRSFSIDAFKSMTTDGTIRDVTTVAAAHLFFHASESY